MQDRIVERQERMDAIQRMLRHVKKIEDDVNYIEVEINALRALLREGGLSIDQLMKNQKRIAELIGSCTNLGREHSELMRRLAKADETLERDFPSKRRS